ncbi:MAG: RIO1 family regulatory kinase/ATPase [Actinocatenispora sp.]
MRDTDPIRRGRRRFDDEPGHGPGNPYQQTDDDWFSAEDPADDPDAPPAGDRWSTWDRSTAGQRGPRPHPDWLVTELAAVDTELGVLKTGKEADVHLLHRGVPGTDRGCLLAAKRYRDTEHRMFRRDGDYRQGRRVRRSRTNRAMANRSAFGRQVIAGQWAEAEFGALCALHDMALPVPYPAQIVDTELLMEFVGDPDGTPAPRLAETPYRGGELADLWDQLVEVLVTLARHGSAHGDLSAYNLLVHGDRLVLIDLPQIVDVISNPNGGRYLDRDADNVATWFVSRGLTGGSTDPGGLAELLRHEARLS